MVIRMLDPSVNWFKGLKTCLEGPSTSNKLNIPSKIKFFVLRYLLKPTKFSILGEWLWVTTKSNLYLKLVASWYIWKAMNHYIFSNQPLHPISILHKTLNMIHEWNTVQNLNICPQVIGSILDRWTCSQEGWVKLNFVGFVDLVRSIIYGYTGKIRFCNPLAAELMALLFGL